MRLPTIANHLGTIFFAAILLTAIGCERVPTEQTDDDSFKKAAPDAMKILIVGEASIGPKLKRQWKSRMDGELTIVDQTEKEWIAGEFSIPADVDLVVYPTSFIGELSESKKISKIDNSVWSSDAVDKGSYLDHYGRSIVRYGNEPMAIPLGNPHFSMIYDQSRLSGMTQEGTERTMLPGTWEELEGLLKQNNSKIELPLGEGWAGYTLVCRVASNVRAVGSFSVLFDRPTMKPQIAKPPFVAALKRLQQLATEHSLEAGPSDAFESVVSGDAVAGLGWPAKFVNGSNEGSSQDEKARGSLVVGAVPGASRVSDFRRNEWKNRSGGEDQRADLVGISGLVVSMVKGNQHEYSAIEFLKWVSEAKIVLSIATESTKTGPVRVSHLGNIGGWAGDRISLDLADEYADVVRQVHGRNMVVLFPRIPGSHRYYAALDAGVRAAIENKQDPTEALQSVADQWEAITESIGRDNQIKAMRHESGF